MPKIAIKKVAIYIRVSTVHQVDKFSLPMQRRDLSTYSELILGIPDYEIFEDAGYSGGNTDRPAYQNMMTRIRKGEFSHLLVWKLDRISRNLLDLLPCTKSYNAWELPSFPKQSSSTHLQPWALP